MALKRLLFASTHCLMDPSSGAATATRDLLELLAARGTDCRAVCAGLLDFEASTPLEAALAAQGVPFRHASAGLQGGASAAVLDLEVGGVRMLLAPTGSSRADRSPTPGEAAAWLGLALQALGRFRPEVLLTYGGHPAGLELMRQARRLGVRVVFHLHNFGYADASAFADASAVVVPSDYARRHYARALGLGSIVLPYALRPERVVASDPRPRYVSFVNPQAAKGAAVFARVAAELGDRRPEIPILVVEGRAGALGLADLGVDLSSHPNLHRMANTPDPRDFYRESRVVLMPSLWRESFGRVAAEAMANGIPVLASDRGALPETLGASGFVFHVPPRCGPDGLRAPTRREVAPWVAAIERLWDDPAFEARHRALARAEAARWTSEDLIDQYERSLLASPPKLQK